jgi:hypothetical protein
LAVAVQVTEDPATRGLPPSGARPVAVGGPFVLGRATVNSLVRLHLEPSGPAFRPSFTLTQTELVPASDGTVLQVQRLLVVHPVISIQAQPVDGPLSQNL